MHEVFLQRLAAHPTLRSDVNFKVFLEYDQDVSWYHFQLTTKLKYKFALEHYLYDRRTYNMKTLNNILIMLHYVFHLPIQLSVRGKNKKEKISGFFRNVTQSADEAILSNHKVIH